MYKILGASHFTLYKDVIHDNSFDCILNYYEDLGGVTLVPWHNLDIKYYQKELRNEGMLNDCLYRNMYRYEYLAVVDFNNFIIPTQEYTILDLMRFLFSIIY